MDYQKESQGGFSPNSRDDGKESGGKVSAESFIKFRERVLQIPTEAESREKIAEDMEADPANGKATYRALQTNFKSKYSIASPEEIVKYEDQDPENPDKIRLRPVALLRRELNETDLQRVSQLLEIPSVKEMLEQKLERDKRFSEAQLENDSEVKKYFDRLLEAEKDGLRLTTIEDRDLQEYKLYLATKKDRPEQTDFERNKKELGLKEMADLIARDLMQLDKIVGKASQTEPAFGKEAKKVADTLYSIQGNYKAYLRLKKNRPGFKNTLVSALSVPQA